MKKIGFILFLSLLTFVLIGQQKEQVYPKALEKAALISVKSPEKAIDMVKAVISESKQKRDWLTEGQSYYLLGDIYEKNNQKDLALYRYQQALSLLSSNREDKWAALTNFKIGNIHLALNQENQAANAFTICKDLTTSEDLKIQCQEGLADVAVLLGDFQQGKQLYNLTEGYYQRSTDTLSMARVNAKKAELFIFSGDVDQATQSFNNSINALSSTKLAPRDYTPFDKINRLLLDSSKTDLKRIELRQFNLNNKSRFQLPAESLIEEQLALAALYRNTGKTTALEQSIQAAKGLLDETIDAEYRAKVFQLASEWSLEKGDLINARKDYQQYLAENEKVIRQKEAELNQQIAIIRNQGSVDIAAKEVDLAMKDRELLQNQMYTQNIIIISLGILLLAAVISLILILRSVRARKRANELLQLRSLRTQMNPHFIFNALNSVNNFISQHDERAANKFLADFSKLMRMVLDFSQRDFITFEEETQLLQLYLKLEQLRFRDKFEYQFEQDPATDTSIEIPPMLIQPFIENAVWHGLRYKTEKGFLKVSIKAGERCTIVEIADDGIGRLRSQALKTKNQNNYQSTGLRNAQERIALINKLYSKNYQLDIKDFQVTTDAGTLVSIQIPH